MDFIIRPVEEKDLMEVAEICINGWKNAYRGIVDSEYLDSLNVNEKYERFKSNYQEGNFIVAANDDRALGFCRFCDEYRDNPDDDEIDCELCALYVSWEERGKGIGTALVNFVKEYFKSIGKNKMIIWCFKENKKAIAFYEKMGGVHIGYKDIERGGKQYQEVGFLYDL